MKPKYFLLFSVLFFVACGDQETNLRTEVEVPVSVEEIKLKPIEEFLITTGTVKALKEVLLISESAGFYQLLNNKNSLRPFILGDYVKKGDVIIFLANPEVENNIKIESQNLNLDISKSEFEKQQSLYDKGGVTLRELKNSERAFMDAQYNYDNAVIQLNKMKITAPFDGVIVELPYYTPGVKVASNQPLVKIMNYSKLYLEVNLPGKELGQIKVNRPVRIMNYTLPDDTLNGRVAQVAPAIDPDTRSFKTSITIDNPKLLLRPGMFVKAEIVVARKDSAIVIPKNIIMSRRRGNMVFFIERGVARERYIQTGLENPDEIEVIRGLSENDRVVIKGFETLRNRSKVKILVR